MEQSIWSKRFGADPKEGLHKFMEKHSPKYKRSQAEDFVDAFLKSEGKYDGQHGFKRKMNRLQANFPKFRIWFFDKNRPRIKHEL